MPHTITQTFYACDKCSRHYGSWDNAQACESFSLLEENENLRQFNVGDEINFLSESPGLSRWITIGSTAKIVEKKMVSNNQKHQYLYWTDSGEGVLWLKNDYGWGMVSPAELKRQLV